MTARCPGMSPDKATAKFNRMQGKLRVSLTHACQLRCRFCHQEGIESHWNALHMPIDYFDALLNAYAEIGGIYLELTGGEPLLHPRISEILRMASALMRKVFLHTNGLQLREILPELESGCVQLIRLSLHEVGNSEHSRWLLGRSWDYYRVIENLERVLQTRTPIQFLYTLTGKNAQSLPKVLDLALKFGVDLQLVDLIQSRKRNTFSLLGYLGGDVIERQVRKRSRYEATIRDRTGATLQIFKTPEGATWEVKSTHYGLLHTDMCSGCTLRARCGEGIYALRVDAAGVIKPCLLRQDLDIKTSVSPIDRSQLHSALANLLILMMSSSFSDCCERLHDKPECVSVGR